MDTFVVSFCPLDPDSSDFGDVCAFYAPFLHQLTMQSSLFERGCPVLVVVCVARKLRPCPSYSRRRDRINLGHWRSLYKGWRGTERLCRALGLLTVSATEMPLSNAKGMMTIMNRWPCYISYSHLHFLGAPVVHCVHSASMWPTQTTC